MTHSDISLLYPETENGERKKEEKNLEEKE